MKRLFIFLLCSSIITSLLGQSASNSESRDTDDVYFIALMKYCQEITKLDNLFVELNSLTTEGMPSNIAGVNIVYLRSEQIRSKTKKRRELILHRVVPIRFENGIFYINIIRYRVRRKGKKMYYVNLGEGRTIEFVYECTMDMLVLK